MASGVFFRHSGNGRICRLRHPAECRAKGSWTYKTVIDGKARWRGGFRREKEAIDALAALRTDVARRTHVEPTRVTFGDWLDQWQAGLDLRVRPATAASYRWLIEKRVTDDLRKIKLHRLERRHLEALYADIAAMGLEPSARALHRVLRAALSAAVEDRLILVNPATRVRFARQETRELTVWGPDEATAFLEHIRDHRLVGLYALAILTGLRRGELCSLLWRDVDLAAGTLTVRRSKTGKPRKIALGPSGVGVLRDHAARQAEEMAAASYQSPGDLYEQRGFVFARPDGRRADDQQVSKDFVRLTQSAGLPRIRFHDLRHTHATLALKANVPLKVISERLGHARISVTADIYQSVLDGMDREAASAVEALLVTSQLQSSFKTADEAQPDAEPATPN